MSVKFTDNSQQIKTQFENNLNKALEMMGVKNQELSTKEITDMRAVDTGRLRASMTYQVDAPNKQVIVGTNVSYAPYVHEGTHRMASRPFLKNSILNYREDYKEIIQKTLGEGFDLKTKI